MVTHLLMATAVAKREETIVSTWLNGEEILPIHLRIYNLVFKDVQKLLMN